MTEQIGNGFLRSLTDASRERIRKSLEWIDLEKGQYLAFAKTEVDLVVFPETALLSQIASDDRGRTVETSMVGREGAWGLLEACGSRHAGVNCVVQVDGGAWRAPASAVKPQVFDDEAFAARAWTLAELQLAESRQSAFCQARHTVPERFARWLLESLERSGRRNPLPLRQEFVAAMLGVQRTTISGFAAKLQQDGLIDYSRGRVTIRDEEGLARHSCVCREAVRAERARLGFAL